MSDFAEEASYGSSDLALRPQAPRFREEHIWGIRDDRDNQIDVPVRSLGYRRGNRNDRKANK